MNGWSANGRKPNDRRDGKDLRTAAFGSFGETGARRALAQTALFDEGFLQVAQLPVEQKVC